MSFLTPVKVPVKVYLSTDKDAPKLDRTPNCVATILKACLVTGYGDKQPAGWSLAFEDNPKGVKVLKPADSPHTPFVVKLSGDTGIALKAEVFSDAEQAQVGNPILRHNSTWYYTQFSYRSNGRWVVIACDRAFWFFNETGTGVLNKNGSYMYCGDTAQSTKGERAVVLVQSFQNGIAVDSSTIQGAIFNRTTTNIRPSSYFNGTTVNGTHHALLSPTFLRHENEVFGLPVFMASNTKAENYQILTTQGRNFMCHGHTIYGESNAFIPTDYWEF